MFKCQNLILYDFFVGQNENQKWTGYKVEQIETFKCTESMKII